jgi:hypothetical protein
VGARAAHHKQIGREGVNVGLLNPGRVISVVRDRNRKKWRAAKLK